MRARELLKLLRDHGWEIVSQSGSHVKLRKNERSVIVPQHGTKDIAMGTLRAILKQVGIDLGR